MAGPAAAFVAIARLLSDTENVDNIDVILCLVAGITTLTAGLNAGSVDFVCTGGSACINGVQTYGGDWPLVFPLSAVAFVSLFFMFIAIVKTIQIRNWRKSLGMD